MSKLNKDEVIENFTAAYEKANGKTPDIENNGSWYSVDGGKNIRLAQLQEWTEELSSDTKDAKPRKKSKAGGKPAQKSASKAEFSVKSYWAAKIQSQDAGGKLPR